MHIHIYIHIYIGIHIHVYVYIHIHVYIYIHVHVYFCIYIYINIYKYIYIYMHIVDVRCVRAIQKCVWKREKLKERNLEKRSSHNLALTCAQTCCTRARSSTYICVREMRTRAPASVHARMCSLSSQALSYTRAQSHSISRSLSPSPPHLSPSLSLPVLPPLHLISLFHSLTLALALARAFSIFFSKPLWI